MTRECRRACWRDTLGRIVPPRPILRLAASLIISNLLLLLLVSNLIVGIASSEGDNRATRSRRTYHPTFSRSLLSSTNRNDGIRSVGRPTVRRPSPDVSQDDTSNYDTFDDVADAIKESGSARMTVRVGRGGGGEDGTANGKRQEMVWLRRGMAAARGEARVVDAVASGGGVSSGGSSGDSSSSGGISSSGGSSNGDSNSGSSSSGGVNGDSRNGGGSSSGGSSNGGSGSGGSGSGSSNGGGVSSGGRSGAGSSGGGGSSSSGSGSSSGGSSRGSGSSGNKSSQVQAGTRPTLQPNQLQQPQGATAAGKKPPRRGGTAPRPIGISPHWPAKRKKKCGRRCGVMNRPIAIYLLWYGVFSDAQKALVRALIASLNPSADAALTVPLWWNINRLYYDRDMNYISGNVTVRGEVEDTGYSQGTMLLDSAVDTIICNAVTSTQLPFDKDGVYFVLSDDTVDQVSDGLAFCSDYCGWHWYTKVPGQGLLVSSWVGNAVSKCRSSCIVSQLSSGPGYSPNGDVGMDGLLSVFAHELAEATSDPFMSAWFDSDGEENADKCAWEFGDMLFDSLSGPFYNLVGVNNQKFLIQQNWNLLKGTCVSTVSYSNLAASTTPSPPQQASGGGIGRLIGRIIGGRG